MSAALIAHASGMGKLLDRLDEVTLPLPFMALATEYGIQLGLRNLEDLTAWALHMGTPIGDSLTAGDQHHFQVQGEVLGHLVTAWCATAVSS